MNVLAPLLSPASFLRGSLPPEVPRRKHRHLGLQ